MLLVLCYACTSSMDKMLDSYEKCVNQYIECLKKIDDGDLSAMTEYMKLMTELTEFADKMGNAKGELSNAQMKRYLEITTKYTTDLIDITK